jgi:hypothetical protein
LPDGTPAKADYPKRNAGHALSSDLIEAINELPQIKSGHWSKSYLAEQLWRNYLKLPTEHSWEELEMIAQKQVIE